MKKLWDRTIRTKRKQIRDFVSQLRLVTHRKDIEITVTGNRTRRTAGNNVVH